LVLNDLKNKHAKRFSLERPRKEENKRAEKKKITSHGNLRRKKSVQNFKTKAPGPIEELFSSRTRVENLQTENIEERAKF
jgi:hypothetical protein